MVHRERAFRGISARLARHYLEKLGGEIEDESTVEGDGWTVELSTDTVEIGRSLELTEVTVRFEGEDVATVEDIEARFAKKAMRAGG